MMHQGPAGGMHALLINIAGALGSMGSKHDKDVPVEHQLAVLGLDRKLLRALRGKRICDIACGNGALVEYLREQGLDARGVDPRAPHTPYFSRRRIDLIGIHRGIPVEDGSLDLITSFQNSTLNCAYGSLRDKWRTHLDEAPHEFKSHYSRVFEQAPYTIAEIGRTLCEGGRAIIYPALDHLENEGAHLLQMDGLSVSYERIPKSALRAYYAWEGIYEPSSKKWNKTRPLHSKRLVLTKRNE